MPTWAQGEPCSLQSLAARRLPQAPKNLRPRIAQQTVQGRASPPAATEQPPGQQPTPMGQPGLNSRDHTPHICYLYKSESDLSDTKIKGINPADRYQAVSRQHHLLGPQEQNTCCGLSVSDTLCAPLSYYGTNFWGEPASPHTKQDPYQAHTFIQHTHSRMYTHRRVCTHPLCVVDGVQRPAAEAGWAPLLE